MAANVMFDLDAVTWSTKDRSTGNLVFAESIATLGLLLVIFGVVRSRRTSVVAFAPMVFVTGNMGKVMRQIPLVVIAVLLMSLVEALLILPAHLAGRSIAPAGVAAWNPAFDVTPAGLVDGWVTEHGGSAAPTSIPCC